LNSSVVNILFVCLGNICRSPTAEGIFAAAARRAGVSERFRVDSAGTHAWRLGGPPAREAIAVARAQGIDIAKLRARRVHAEDFSRFDYIIAMDRANLANLKVICPTGCEGRLYLLSDFVTEGQRCDVPDPYGEGPAAFERTFQLIARGVEGLLQHLLQKATPR
jgi:protein-tyrosine phosphatase